MIQDGYARTLATLRTWRCRVIATLSYTTPQLGYKFVRYNSSLPADFVLAENHPSAFVVVD